jgi:hypothetical protein
LCLNGATIEVSVAILKIALILYIHTLIFKRKSSSHLSQNLEFMFDCVV